MKARKINKADKRRHIVTVQLEDYFHVAAFNQMIGEKQWHRFEGRLESNVDATCNLLRKFDIKATFFALGWLGDMQPGLIKKIASEGHEIASGGYWKRSVKDMTPAEFRNDVRRSKTALENAGSNKIIGYRCPHKRLDNSDLWVLDILAEEGYVYDASYCPPLILSKREPFCYHIHKHATRHGTIWEIPMSTVSILGYNFPISGGNYFRQIPHRLMMSAFKKWCSETEAPFVLYFHPWELDPDQPRVTSAGFISAMRQYRNLNKMKWILPIYFRQAQFQSINQHLNVSLEYPRAGHVVSKPKRLTLESGSCLGSRPAAMHSLPEVSIVVPCYNEATSLPYLKKALEELTEKARNKYELYFIFVDDGSTDDTYMVLQNLFRADNSCKILRNKVNQGIASALFTGLISADTEIACSIDADCSYDPLILLDMIPLLKGGVDMVTASPYHRHGHVLNVPGWRLLLSKSLSRIYQHVLPNKLSTYTSFLRVYRHSTILNLFIKHKDFLGITEMIAKLDIDGGTIVEYPTSLQCRIFGYSKMKVLSTIIGHLKLLVETIRYRYQTHHGQTRPHRLSSQQQTGHKTISKEHQQTAIRISKSETNPNTK